jgi:transposase
MRKIREVLRLGAEGLSQRAIAQSCNISHSTVGEYLRRAARVGLSWPLPDELDEDTLQAKLFARPTRSGAGKPPLPDWEKVHLELRRKSVTLRLLWLEYRQVHPDGYGYSRFCDLYRVWAKKVDPPMHLVHRGGEKMFVDYAGHTIPVVDPETCRTRQAQIFIAVLGASSYTYAEGQWSQALPNWIGGHVRALRYWGGVPRLLIPDNIKAGVTHPCRYEPDLNPTYQEMAVYYGVGVIPTRVRKPKDKAKVEVGVQVVERWILARLRNRTFFSLPELNRMIWELLEELNGRTMCHVGKSRRELFEALDCPALRPLPSEDYEYALWKKVKVGIDYHISYDKHHYSVHHALMGEKVFIRATERTVEIFHKHQRVASHVRSWIQGGHTTATEHMPPAHQHYAQWTQERFLSWGEKIGPRTRELVGAVLEDRRHPEHASRTVLGLLRLARSYGEERLEAAAGRAIAARLLTYKGLKNILEAGLDGVPPEQPAQTRLVHHAHIRGASYYSQGGERSCCENH